MPVAIERMLAASSLWDSYIAAALIVSKKYARDESYALFDSGRDCPNAASSTANGQSAASDLISGKSEVYHQEHVSQCSTFFRWRWGSASLPRRSPMFTPAIGCEEALMIFDYSLAAAVTVGLMVYLTFALLRPERF